VGGSLVSRFISTYYVTCQVRGQSSTRTRFTNSHYRKPVIIVYNVINVYISLTSM